jgi:hypothetical protein
MPFKATRVALAIGQPKRRKKVVANQNAALQNAPQNSNTSIVTFQGAHLPSITVSGGERSTLSFTGARARERRRASMVSPGGRTFDLEPLLD